MPTTISFRTQESKRDELDQIADSLDRDRTWVLNEAIDRYLDLHRWQLERVKKSIATVKGGRTLTTVEVRARLAGRGSKARDAKAAK